MKEIKEMWIIVDIKKNKAIYGIEDKTFNFSSREIAIEVAQQIFKSSNDFMVLEVNL